MSFLTGTNAELIYSNTAVGAAKASFTAEAQINDATSMGTQPVIPGFFFGPTASSAGKAIRVVARGILSSTGTPTFQLAIRLNTAINAVTGPIALGAPAGIATASGAANLSWVLEGDFMLVAPKEPTGANSTILGSGLVSGSAMASHGIYAGASATAPTVSIDIGQAYYLTVSAVCQTSSPSNSITLQQLLVYGLN